jgi:hypothetical protein
MNTEHELFGELHEQEENGLFGNEHRRQYEAHQEALRQPLVSGRVCFSSDCFYNDKTLNTCVGDYDKCTVKQTHR